MQIKDILKHNKLKITKARLGIVEVLASHHGPLTVDQIRAMPGLGSINTATVYRTIEALVSIGLVSRVDLRRGAVSYELKGRHHHHIVCKLCGLVEDFELCHIESITNKVKRKSKNFKSIDDHSFELFGVCNKCHKNK